MLTTWLLACHVMSTHNTPSAAPRLLLPSLPPGPVATQADGMGIVGQRMGRRGTARPMGDRAANTAPRDARSKPTQGGGIRRWVNRLDAWSGAIVRFWRPAPPWHHPFGFLGNVWVSVGPLIVLAIPRVRGLAQGILLAGPNTWRCWLIGTSVGWWVAWTLVSGLIWSIVHGAADSRTRHPTGVST